MRGPRRPQRPPLPEAEAAGPVAADRYAPPEPLAVGTPPLLTAEAEGEGWRAAPQAPNVAAEPYVSTDEVRLGPSDPDGEDVFGGEAAAGPMAPLANLCGVKFREAGIIHEYDAGEVSYRRGERVVVESERGQMIGVVAVASMRMPYSETLRRILRRASAEDEQALERNVQREGEALAFCRERVRVRQLPMKVIRAEYPLHGSKLLLYFTSEERIDFRELVKDIAHKFHGRIELRQVGARDEARMIGGIGACGRELCCSTFLPAFAPVSIKMAKDQGLVLNPSKIAGQCGRLKCCLVYEQDLYKEMRKGLPKVGKLVRTPAGEGKVAELDVLRQRIRVVFQEGGAHIFPADSVTLLAPPGPGGGGPGPAQGDAGSDDA
ncbi:MAG TPA: regulatory iron-sulfur-containing complex subunit RicT [Polyangia bacterium]|nr:regulatory iron-sulfur-containing complex subunit RicT [Polyangia bacterium]